MPSSRNGGYPQLNLPERTTLGRGTRASTTFRDEGMDARPAARGVRGAHETDTDFIGDGKRDAILFGLQVDASTNSASSSLCGLRSRRCGYSWLHSHRP